MIPFGVDLHPSVKRFLVMDDHFVQLVAQGYPVGLYVVRPTKQLDFPKNIMKRLFVVLWGNGDTIYVDIITGKLSISVANMELVYWTVRSYCRRGGVGVKRWMFILASYKFYISIMMNIPNDDTQNYPFCRLQLVV